MGKNSTYEELERRVIELEKEADMRKRMEGELKETQQEISVIFSNLPENF